MEESAQNTVTRLLGQMWDGDSAAAGELLGLIYSELHALARRSMAGQRKDHTLQPTALVNEAYLRLVNETGDSVANKERFMELAARAMRRVLVDHARFRSRQKRKPEGAEVALDQIAIGGDGRQADVPDIMELHNALEELAHRDARMVKIVELRYFGGFDQAQTAKILKLSERTVQREWRAAKAWLRGRLK